MTLSAHEIKNLNHRRSLRDRPHPDSRIGRFYDALLTGNWIRRLDFVSGKTAGATYNALRVRYDLEIEHKRIGPIIHARCIGIWTNDGLMTLEEIEQALELNQKG